MYLLLV